MLDEYIAAQTYNFDRPEGHMNVGNLAAARGDAQAAIAQYQQAIAIDPLFTAAYVNLADVYRATGKEVDAQVILRQGIKADPRSAVLHHTLGLALTRQKARDVALQEFKTAVQLAPADARFAYVYAVALNDAGQTADALSVLKTSLKVNPHDVDLLTGLVYFSQQAGDGAAARGYLAQLRDLDPAIRNGISCSNSWTAPASSERTVSVGERDRRADTATQRQRLTASPATFEDAAKRADSSPHCRPASAHACRSAWSSSPSAPTVPVRCGCRSRPRAGALRTNAAAYAGWRAFRSSPRATRGACGAE